MRNPVEEYCEDWQPPETFRAAVVDIARLADLLADQVDGQLLVRSQDIEFLARRLARQARETYAALPPEVI